MPLPERFTHWLQADDDDLLGYDAAEDDLMLPAVEELAPLERMPWRPCDLAGEHNYVQEDD
jgi:hypothetical protein